MKKKALIIILRISGFTMLLAFIAVFLPYQTMANIHRQIGLGDFPQLPILAYLARSVSLFYGIHGIITLYISFDLDKYLQFLKYFCYIGFLFSSCLFFIDLTAPMPASWTFFEGPLVFGLNLLIYVMVIKMEKGK